MKKSKKSCGVYDYLSGLGLLSHGSDEAIIQAKKAYWATVRKEWKKIKRAQCKSVTIFFTTEEANIILKAAKNVAIARYVKEAAIAYGNKRFVIDKIAVGEIRQELILHYMTIQKLLEESKIDQEIALQLLQQVSNIETKTMQQLKHT